MPITHQRSAPVREVASGLRTVPAVATDLTTTDSVIYQIVIANKTAAAVTFTVLDKAATPKSLLSAVSIGANTTTVVTFPDGVWMTGGINWSASAANSLDSDVYATYKG